MAERITRITRRGVELFWLVSLGLVLVVVGVGHAAPHLDGQIIVVRGPSMEPAIPLGSALFIQPRAAEDIEAGQVITFRYDNGTMVTHRVTQVIDQNGALFFATRGDANPDPDPQPVPASAIVGVTQFHAPFAGYLLVLLSKTLGLFAVISFFLGLLLTAWLLQEVEEGLRGAPDADAEADPDADPSAPGGAPADPVATPAPFGAIGGAAS